MSKNFISESSGHPTAPCHLVTLWLHKSVIAYLSLLLCLFLCGVLSLSLNLLSVSFCLCFFSASVPLRVSQSCPTWLCLFVSLPLCRCLSGSVSLSILLCPCLLYCTYISTLLRRWTARCACVFIRQIFVLDLLPEHSGNLSKYFSCYALSFYSLQSTYPAVLFIPAWQSKLYVSKSLTSPQYARRLCPSDVPR